MTLVYVKYNEIPCVSIPHIYSEWTVSVLNRKSADCKLRAVKCGSVYEEAFWILQFADFLLFNGD